MTKIVELLNVDKLPWHMEDKTVTESMSLKGKVAAVTGSGGPNLGRSIAHRLAGLGATVAVVDLDADGAAKVAAELRERWGVEAAPFQGDVADAASVSRFVDQIVEQFGTIDVWVNNVGLAMLPSQPPNKFSDLSPSDIDWLVGVNLKGALYCTRKVLDVMLPRRSGRIINIASESGKSWAIKRTVYSTCKAGVIGFTRALSHELAGSGVSVVAVCPGIMMGRAAEKRLRALPDDTDDPWPTVLANTMSRVSAGRASIPEEVANMVAFLSTEAGWYIQGTSISAGGGSSDG